MGWMRRPEQAWPCKRTFGQVHEEEMCQDMVAVACPASASKKDMQPEEDEPFKAAKIRLDRILRVYGYVFAAV
jgi:hypothetical protein